MLAHWQLTAAILAQALYRFLANMYPPESAEWIGCRGLWDHMWLPQAAILVAFETSCRDRRLVLWAWWEVFPSHQMPGAEDRRALLLCTEVYTCWRLDEMDIPNAAWPLRDAAWGRWP